MLQVIDISGDERFGGDLIEYGPEVVERSDRGEGRAIRGTKGPARDSEYHRASNQIQRDSTIVELGGELSVATEQSSRDAGDAAIEIEYGLDEAAALYRVGHGQTLAATSGARLLARGCVA